MTADTAGPRVALSNGYGQFHLQDVADHLASHGLLDRYLSGVHLRIRGRWARRLVGLLGPAGGRLLGRELRSAGAVTRRAWLGEGLHQLARRSVHAGWTSAAAALEAASLVAYGRAMRRTINNSTAPVYHYRAGFGNASLQAARSRGMILLCDHSIAHPAYLRRTLPSTSSVHGMRTFWDRVAMDIDQADHLLVNSQFVKDTCVAEGIGPEFISTVPTVPDDRIIEALHVARDRQDPPVALFVGSFEHRKGVRELVAAVAATEHLDLRWILVGYWEPEALQHRPAPSERVVLRPRLPRHEVAELMTRSTFFVFPTWAEGSARVVAEALHAGCHVVTTHNAGSLVRDGIDGSIIPVGDAGAIVRALEDGLATSSATREERSAGTARRARELLTPQSYREGVLQVHRDLVAGRLALAGQEARHG